MRDIVATLQAEQGEITRVDRPEVLVIEGGPGARDLEQSAALFGQLSPPGGR
jgi:hypothetical protein